MDSRLRGNDRAESEWIPVFTGMTEGAGMTILTSYLSSPTSHFLLSILGITGGGWNRFTREFISHSRGAEITSENCLTKSSNDSSFSEQQSKIQLATKLTRSYDF